MDIPLAKSATAELMDEQGADVAEGEGCDDASIDWVVLVADGSPSAAVVAEVCWCVRFDNVIPPAAAVDLLTTFRRFESRTKSATDVARASASDVVVVVVAAPHCFVFGREVRDVITEEDDGGVGRAAALRPFIFGYQRCW